MPKKSYAVLGLGSFGTKLAIQLSRMNNHVLVCDISPERVDELRDVVTDAVIADVTHEEAVRELDVRRFDAVILGMSSFFEKQILALTLLKQEGARRIFVKATSDIQETILYRLGADEVIQPDLDVARRLSRKLSLTNITDLLEFKGSAFAEVRVPEMLSGKTLKELNLRKNHRVTVLLLGKKDSGKDVHPTPDSLLETGDRMTVFGDRDSIMRLFKEK